MLDSNVHDLVAADQAVIEAIEQHIADGRLILVSSHVQRDELSRTPEPKRTALLAIYGMTQKVPTTGAAWGVSKWDESTWGTEAVNASIAAHMAGNIKHAEDALIAATAAERADILVTNETSLASKIKRAGFSTNVWSWDQFAAWLK